MAKVHSHYFMTFAETASQQEVLRSFGEAKGLAFSKDGKLLAVGVHDAVHIHDWPSLVSRATIRWVSPQPRWCLLLAL